MSWEKELAELERRRALAARMAVRSASSASNAAGKLTVRERVDRLVDAASFEEIGSLTGRGRYENGELVEFSPANFVFGRRRSTATGGRRGRRFHGPRRLGGSVELHEAGCIRATGARPQGPIVRLVDGSGGGGSVKGLGDDAPFNRVPAIPTGARSSLRCPRSRWSRRRSARSRASGGEGRCRALLGDGEGTSHVFVAGPPLVPYATGGEGHEGRARRIADPHAKRRRRQ